MLTSLRKECPKRQRIVEESSSGFSSSSKSMNKIHLTCSKWLPLWKIVGEEENDLVYERTVTPEELNLGLQSAMKEALCSLHLHAIKESRSDHSSSAQILSWMKGSSVVPVLFQIEDMEASWMEDIYGIFDSTDQIRRSKRCELAASLKIPEKIGEIPILSFKKLKHATLALFILDRYKTHSMCLLGLTKGIVCPPFVCQLSLDLKPWKIPDATILEHPKRTEKTTENTPKELSVTIPLRSVLDTFL